MYNVLVTLRFVLNAGRGRRYNVWTPLGWGSSKMEGSKWRKN